MILSNSSFPWLCTCQCQAGGVGGGGGEEGEGSLGRDFDIFPKIAVKFPSPGQKCEVKYTEIPHPRKWFVVTGTNKN